MHSQREVSSQRKPANLTVSVPRSLDQLLAASSDAKAPFSLKLQTIPSNRLSQTPTRTPHLKQRSPPVRPRTRIITQGSAAELNLLLELLFEQKRLLHRRKYLKVYENLFTWIQKEERAFFLGLEVKLLRYFLNAMTHLLRNKMNKKLLDFNKTQNLISQTLCVFGQYYKFLTTALNMELPDFDCNKVLIAEGNNYPELESDVSERENEDLPPFLDLMAGKHGSFELFQNKVNPRPEAAFFVVRMLEIVILIGIYYKRNQEYQMAYSYLKKAHKLALELEASVNADLLFMCEKAHLAFAVFLLTFRKFKKAKKVLKRLLVLVQAELCYRMSLSRQNELRKHEKLKLKRSVKMLLCVLMNLVSCFEDEKDIVKINETLVLIEFFCVTFLNQNTDEFRKTMVKLSKDTRRRFVRYFAESTELDGIIENSLKNDLEFKEKLNPMYFPPSFSEDINKVVIQVPKAVKLLSKIKRSPLRGESSLRQRPNTAREVITADKRKKSQTLASFKAIQNLRKTRFSLDLRTAKVNSTHTNNNFNITNSETTRRTASSFKQRPPPEGNNNNNNTNTNFLASETNRMNNTISERNSLVRSSSLFINENNNNSFMFSEEDSSSEFFDTSDQQNLKNSLLFQKKIGLSFEKIDKKLINGHFKRLKDDYKPKVLTTDEYFLKRVNKKPEQNKNKPQDFIKPRDGILLDSLFKFPRKHKYKNKTMHNKEDYITTCFEDNINESLKQGNTLYKSPKEINENFMEMLKIEEFDRAEFKFGKQILEAKRKANLNVNPHEHSLFIKKHLLQSKIKDHAEETVAQRELEDLMKTFQKHKTIKNNNKTINNKKKTKYTLVKPKVFVSPPTPNPKPPSPIPNPPPQSPTNNLIKPSIQNQNQNQLSSPRTIASPNLGVPSNLNKAGVGLRSSFVEILVRHKAFFGLENQARIIEKTLQQSKNTLEKDLERQRKRSLYMMDTPVEPSTATKRSLMASPYMPPKHSEILPTPEECHGLTKKTNNMIAEEVKINLSVASRKIDALLINLEPGKRKIKAKRMEDRLKKKPLQDLTLRFRELSLSSGDAKKNF